jgi:hypothetical protein
MPPVVPVVARFPDQHALARSWDVLEGTLSLPVEAPPPGAFVLVDGSVGEVCFLVGGTVVAGRAGRFGVQLLPACRPLIEALIEPSPRRSSRRRAVA